MLIAIAVLLLVAMFAATSAPGWNVFLFAMVSLAWVFFGLIWLILFLTTLTEDPGELSNRLIVAWLVVPVIAVAGAALVRLDVPLWVRFELSRADLETVVAGRPGSIVPTDATRRVGLYEVDLVEDGDVIWFMVPEGGLLTEDGFAFSPAGEPDASGGRCRPLSGPWWVCTTATD